MDKGDVTRQPLPLILVRGFGGLGVEDEKKLAYQGFNDGTVYPQKRGENYIYEGMILRFLKGHWGYRDATNVVAYYGTEPGAVSPKPSDTEIARQREMIPPELLKAGLDVDAFFGRGVLIDPAMARALLDDAAYDPRRTLWVFRYYDLNDREFPIYGRALARLIQFVLALVKVKTGDELPVNIIAHSMGGLIVREAIQKSFPLEEKKKAHEYINKVVTLGTPHRGITFQILQNWAGAAQDELEHFNPTFQEDPKHQASYKRFGEFFPPERLLCVAGTDYGSYAIKPSSWLNRVFSSPGEYGPGYNRSDGLVKQTSAQIPGAPRTFVHKCHGGYDSLVTARESYEVATRFLFGDVRVRLRLIEAEVTRGFDWIGRSEFFFGVSLKPRGVDFDLFHQSKAAENCYGPFRAADLSDKDVAFDWAGPDRLIWEGWLNAGFSLSPDKSDVVMRLDFYLGERDSYGIGFSDNRIFSKQYYVRAIFKPALRLLCYDNEAFANKADPEEGAQAMNVSPGGEGWRFAIQGTGFRATLQVELDGVPETGAPTRLTP